VTAVAAGGVVLDVALGVADRHSSGTPPRAAPAMPAVRFPPRCVALHWPATGADRDTVVQLVAASCGVAGWRRASRGQRGLRLLLEWLEEQDGGTWQQRWLASGADAAGGGWAAGPAGWLERDGRNSPGRLELMTSSLMTAVGADIVRPSLGWLLTGGKKRKVARNMIRSRDPEGFERLRLACGDDPGITAQTEGNIVFRAAVIIAAKGGLLADITIGDVLEILDAEVDLRGKTASGSATFAMLRELGIFGPGVPSLREIRSVGQRSADELVDRYPIACRSIRDLLVDYLKERQPAIDYGTMTNLSYVLAKCFWGDLEAHHRGIDTLCLSADIASSWKLRLRTRNATNAAAGETGKAAAVERLSYLDVLACVRAFYLDLSQWALDDPGRWGSWAAPCPIRPDDLTRRKAVRRRKARMDARTRQRLPVLPVLVRVTDQWRIDTGARLAAARQAPPGEEFTAAGQTLTRFLRPHGAADKIWADDPATGERRLLNREEDHAFWAWAIIEVLRLTGVRVEELLELSHHSLVQYRLPTTGEVVPLLQIAPSKTDAERLVVVSPELADVLSAIICRVRGDTAAVPQVRARDPHEHIWLAPSPLLFQRRQGAENHAISGASVSSLLDEALAHTGLVDHSDGTVLRCTPHDFRRMFITDAVLNGLPPHIAQIIAGHQDINVTLGYKAVYPDEAIAAHLAFLARRRSLRPSEEYRTPTDDEWQEFLGHFERRKVSTGICGRAFGTPCIHEHACVRCPMLWPDPAQRARLAEIRDNLTARITEAQREGWLGELEGLNVSLAGADEKLAQIDRRPDQQPTPLRLGGRPERQRLERTT
jgi:integrase